MNKNRMEGAAEQSERARNCAALVAKAKRRKAGGDAQKECVLTCGDPWLAALCWASRVSPAYLGCRISAPKHRPLAEYSMRRSARSFGIAYRNKTSRGPTQAKLAERTARFQPTTPWGCAGFVARSTRPTNTQHLTAQTRFGPESAAARAFPGGERFRSGRRGRRSDRALAHRPAPCSAGPSP